MTNTLSPPSPASPHTQPLLSRLRQLPLYAAALANVPDSADWASVPFLTRERLTQAFEAGELLHPDAVRVHLTPHPGGHWLPEYATGSDIEGHGKAGAKAFALAGVRPTDHAQIAFGYHRFAGGWIMQDGLEALGAKTIPFGPGESESQLDTIRQLGVRVLVSAPSFAQKLGEAGARVELLISSGEPLTSIAGRREKVEAALGGMALDCYASSEAGLMALETPAKNGLRVLSDWIYLEVIDPETGAVLPDGERGELVVTHLTKEAMPLLRFRTGDLTRIEHREDGVYLPAGVFGNVGGMLKVKGVKLFPREVAFWLAGHGLDHTQHTLRIWSQSGADRIGLQVRGAGEVEALKADFQKRFAMRLDELVLDAAHEGNGVQDERG